MFIGLTVGWKCFMVWWWYKTSQNILEQQNCLNLISCLLQWLLGCPFIFFISFTQCDITTLSGLFFFKLKMIKQILLQASDYYWHIEMASLWWMASYHSDCSHWILYSRFMLPTVPLMLWWWMHVIMLFQHAGIPCHWDSISVHAVLKYWRPPMRQIFYSSKQGFCIAIMDD